LQVAHIFLAENQRYIVCKLILCFDLMAKKDSRWRDVE
jgi:hypothetical protein